MDAFLHLAGSFKRRSVTLVGLGVSNLALAKFLLQKGISFSVRDSKPFSKLGEDALALQEKGIAFFCGPAYLDGLTEQLIFRAPGIRPDLPAFEEAKRNGATVTSEIKLFFDLVRSPVFSVTGSDGKTTTATLIHRILSSACERKGAGTAFLGGNIGNSLLPKVEQIAKSDLTVLELSSFQLFDVDCSAEYALITNLSPNHLNWHKDFEEYTSAKTNLFRHPQNRLFVANAEDPLVFAMTEHHPAKVALFSSKKRSYQEFTWLGAPGTAVYARDGKVYASDGNREECRLELSRFLLPGKHNLENLLGAVALTLPFSDPCDVLEAVKDFRGVRHRLELVATVDGVSYYNSSIDSTPSRTHAALSALPKKPIVICGGYDKNLPFEPLAHSLCEMAKAVVLTGATAKKIRQALASLSPDFPTYHCPCFRDAVLFARSIAKSGDIVLLSPACASFDEFANFEERGNTFCKIVEGFSSAP